MNVTLRPDKRTELGILVADYIDAGLNAQGRLPQWWNDVASQHRNEPPKKAGGEEDPGFDLMHMPFSQPRLDMLTAQVCTVLGKQDPYMICESDDEDVSEAKAQIVHRVWRDAGFEQRIRQASTICGRTDLAYYRLCPRGDGGVEISVHHPSNVVVFPALPSGISEATVVGHRIWKPRWYVTDRQESKAYYDVDRITEGSMESEDETGDIQRSGVETGEPGPDPDRDATVELWDVIVRLDLGQGMSLYRATVARQDRELLALEPYSLSTPWYFESRYVGSLDYYPSTSVGRNLIAPQDAYNYLWSAFYTGAMMAAMPPIFGPKLDSDEKYTKYKWGDYLETDSPVQPWNPNARPQLQPIPVMIERLEQIGDQIARISKNTQGASDTETATEASIIASGVAVGLEEYIANFSFDFPRMAELTLELANADYEAFAQRFGIQEPPPPAPMTGAPTMPPMGMPQ